MAIKILHKCLESNNDFDIYDGKMSKKRNKTGRIEQMSSGFFENVSASVTVKLTFEFNEEAK